MAVVAGLNASGSTYTYTTGSDKKRYATGGEVIIDNSPEKDPEDTIRKMQRVRVAALAPADPSAQDRKVASQASRTEAKARQELAQQKMEESQEAAKQSLNSGNDKETEKQQELIEDFSSLYEATTSGQLAISRNKIDNYA